MARVVIKWESNCLTNVKIVVRGLYPLNVTNVVAQQGQAAPIKWSPEDHHAQYRRRLEGVEGEGWSQKLPTLPDMTEEE